MESRRSADKEAEAGCFFLFFGGGEQAAAAKRPTTRVDASNRRRRGAPALFNIRARLDGVFALLPPRSLSSARGIHIPFRIATGERRPGPIKRREGASQKERERERQNCETERKEATQTRTLATAAAAAAAGCCWASTLEPATSATSATRRKARRAMMVFGGWTAERKGECEGRNRKVKEEDCFFSLSLPLSFLSLPGRKNLETPFLRLHLHVATG